MISNSLLLSICIFFISIIIIKIHVLLYPISGIYYYMSISSLHEGKILKWHNKYTLNYASPSTLYMAYYILHIFKNVKKHNCTHMNIQIDVNYRYIPYQTKFRDGL